MKKILLAPILFCLLPTISCGGGKKKETIVITTPVVEKNDYTSCPYVGLGSHYITTAGTSNNYMSIHFFFESDGTGAWGTYRYEYGKETKELYPFDYRIFGEVNVSYIRRDDDTQGGRGYFTTDSTGQAFACEGLHLSRYS